MTNGIKTILIFVVLGVANSIAWATDDYSNETLCSGAEDVYFSCKLEGTKKIASVCASGNLSPNSGYVQYRYGKKSKVEFKFPRRLVPPMNFFSIIDVSRLAVGLGTHIKFRNGSYQYVISNAIVPGEIYIANAGKPVFEKMCHGADYIPIPQRARDGLQWGVLEEVDALDNH